MNFTRELREIGVGKAVNSGLSQEGIANEKKTRMSLPTLHKWLRVRRNARKRLPPCTRTGVSTAKLES